MSGGEAGRIEKINFISEYSVVKKYLHVCTFSDENNCTVCSKCMRTASALDMGGMLEQYSNIFDLKKYKKQKMKYWANVYATLKDECYGTLNMEYVDQARKLEYEVPVISKIYGGIFLRLYLALKSKLKKIKLLKTLYYKFNLDYLVYGKQKAELYRYSNGIK